MAQAKQSLSVGFARSYRLGLIWNDTGLRHLASVQHEETEEASKTGLRGSDCARWSDRSSESCSQATCRVKWE